MKENGRAVKRFFVREDDRFDHWSSQYQATTLTSRLSYLGLHLLPGILAFLLINVSEIYQPVVAATGISGPLLQGVYLAIFSCLWHLLWPLFSLRWHDKLTIRESLEFLGLGHFDGRGVVLVMPLVLVAFVIFTLPYVILFYPPIKAWLDSIPLLKIPPYSIFQEGRIFQLPAILLVILAIGNYVGEEVYYRGSLLKKIGFLGSWAWVVNSILFGLYHIWQAPETWPIVPSALFFGLLMRWRKKMSG